MQRLKVNIPNYEYDICIGKGIINNVSNLIKEIYSGEKLLVITDQNVYNIYGDQIKHLLKQFKTEVIVVASGEDSKSLECLEIVYRKLVEARITRKDLIIAFGGGVVGDLAGFSASTILRGVPFIQIPTTLLAQVDSSVGGKVAVNLKEGKNLVGSFYQPKMVIIDTDFLNTLDKRVFSDGMGEVIKYGFIQDEALLEKLENTDNIFDIIDDIVYTCCYIKAKIVEEDEHETGIRMILNFGHTYGHGVEKYYDYHRYTHGEAVSIGMCMACKLGEKLGITNKDITDRLIKVLEKYNLPAELEISKQELNEYIKRDKKMESNKVNFLLLKNIGECIVQKLELEVLK